MQETVCTDFLEAFPQHTLHQMPTVLSSFGQRNSSSGSGNICTNACGSCQSVQFSSVSSVHFTASICKLRFAVSEFGTSKSSVLVQHTASECFYDPSSPSSCLFLLHRKALPHTLLTLTLTMKKEQQEDPASSYLYLIGFPRDAYARHFLSVATFELCQAICSRFLVCSTFLVCSRFLESARICSRENP